ncbi:hypothetical protein CAS74_002370 [Pichia kudriavzevii]|uniref:Sphingoid long-chain base transporter RSB1 n=1 Tax=Pichia kudriavzevii TaxID=4909 RepID=A0A099NY73_PICKU|nr:uncharacterized protein C5L36_0D03920 [Pichia kudriavzevii]MDC6274162.1 RTA1 domain-containing protein [Lacticaseibacillus paracasei]AWU77660.1 hypothetical protein C5L36_0D03920 [Pichia kudriavzevii]KGK36826.1 hypothetical protein JL09_g4033 [Pichia kudriavzevii]ONH74654.1 Sphingoid long-chain base transporter RSB1 [Pichia kudriavzevii]OUT22626.1 hypothetical protein CAS74_002370 [Pichia kudriavzevii]
MDKILSYTEHIPAGYVTRARHLTETLQLSVAVPTTITEPYASITSVISSAAAYQSSVYNALSAASNLASSTSLFNEVVAAQATINYYEILREAVTETNAASRASLMTRAAEASEVMFKVVNEYPFYGGNFPSLGGNIALLVVFAVFLSMQVFSGIFFHQYWFLVCWTAGLILEVIGYAGRIWSSQNITNLSAYIMQSVCITVAPCFLMAGIYYIIAQITLIYGEEYSLMKPMRYSQIFIVCDIISIFTQGAGGGMASVQSLQDTGRYIMIGGLAFQVLTMLIFQFLWYHLLFNIYKAYKESGENVFNPEFDFVRRRKLHIPFIIGVSFVVLLIFIRSVYRLAEISEGWSSKATTDEIYFMILEGLMVSLASCVISVLSPGLAYGRGAHLQMTRRKKNEEEFDMDDSFRKRDEL